MKYLTSVDFPISYLKSRRKLTRRKIRMRERGPQGDQQQGTNPSSSSIWNIWNTKNCAMIIEIYVSRNILRIIQEEIPYPNIYSNKRYLSKLIIPYSNEYHNEMYIRKYCLNHPKRKTLIGNISQKDKQNPAWLKKSPFRKISCKKIYEGHESWSWLSTYPTQVDQEKNDWVKDCETHRKLFWYLYSEWFSFTPTTISLWVNIGILIMVRSYPFYQG